MDVLRARLAPPSPGSAPKAERARAEDLVVLPPRRWDARRAWFLGPPVGGIKLTTLHGERTLVLTVGGHHEELREPTPCTGENNQSPVGCEGGLGIVALVLRQPRHLARIHIDREEVEGVALIAGSEGDEVSAR